MFYCKLFAEFGTDPKVQSLSEGMQRRLAMLFCLRCSGPTENMDESEIATYLRISEEELAQTKDVFLKKGFIAEDWSVRNWHKRQAYDAKAASRAKKCRDKKRTATVTEALRDHDGRRTELDLDLDKEIPPQPPLGGGEVDPQAVTTETAIAVIPPDTPAPELLQIAKWAEALRPAEGWGSWVLDMGRIPYDPQWIKSAIVLAIGRQTLRKDFVYGVLRRYARQGGPDVDLTSNNATVKPVAAPIKYVQAEPDFIGNRFDPMFAGGRN